MKNAWMSLAAVPLLLSGVARAELKIAYVDLQRALMEVEEGRNAKSRLQSILDSKQKEIDKEQEDLKKEKDLLDKQRSAMSEDTRAQKEQELQRKVYDLAQRWEKGKAEMANRSGPSSRRSSRRWTRSSRRSPSGRASRWCSRRRTRASSTPRPASI